uniref:Uncharacterized protein n=1 Tax=Amphimedon queenslandica TaxID=400682 RepID=A0A1X7STP9_AMPQE
HVHDSTCTMNHVILFRFFTSFPLSISN